MVQLYDLICFAFIAKHNLPSKKYQEQRKSTDLPSKLMENRFCLSVFVIFFSHCIKSKALCRRNYSLITKN